MRYKHTTVQLLLEGASLALMIAMIVYLLFRWAKMPDQIPMHYNRFGEIDRWGSKYEVWILPGLTLGIYGLITAMSFFPGAWNLPVRITDRNRYPVYQMAKTMIIVLKLEMVALFFYIVWATAGALSLASWFLPVVLVAILGTIIFFTAALIIIGRR